jgi:predicted ATPase
LLCFGSKVTQEIQIQISFVQKPVHYSLTLRPTDDDSLYVAAEESDSLTGDRWGSQVVGQLPAQDMGREASIADRNANEFGDDVRQHLSKWCVYHVHDISGSSPMRKSAQLHDNAFLRPDGSNLLAFLYLLQQKHPDSYALIRAAVRMVAPFFDDFLLRPDPLNEETIRLEWKHKNSDRYFGAFTLSDGSLRFIALATLLLQPDSFLPSVILIDEPELGLHPYAIAILASLAKQASARTQVILATQSPVLLDHFEPDDVVVADLIKGATQLTRLEASRLASWLEDYSLGQLWEKNELGRRPRKG